RAAPGSAAGLVEAALLLGRPRMRPALALVEAPLAPGAGEDLPVTEPQRAEAIGQVVPELALIAAAIGEGLDAVAAHAAGLEFALVATAVEQGEDAPALGPAVHHLALVAHAVLVGEGAATGDPAAAELALVAIAVGLDQEAAAVPQAVPV